MDHYVSGIGVCAGSYMLKWNMLDMHMQNQILKIKPKDRVNVFINFECVLKNLANHKHGLNLLYHKQKMVLELESAILNLLGSYKSYFAKDKCEVKLYFYYTDLKSSMQQMQVYNKYYRQYYHNKYMENPQFKQMGDVLSDIVIPEVKLIITYIKDCYFIESNTFDSSLIPLMISEESDAKNVIITGDIFDTLYMFHPNFITIYISRRYYHFHVRSDIEDMIRSILKTEDGDFSIFKSEMYYRLLLSIRGNKIRNIRSAKGFGYTKLMQSIKYNTKKDIVLKDMQSLDSILNIFPPKYQEDIKQAFQCTSIDTQYSLISDSDKEFVKSQIVDKIDNDSLMALNNKRFLEFPINLPTLI